MTELVSLAAFAKSNDAAVRLVRNPGSEDPDWAIELIWGSEAPDSPMAGAAAYGTGSEPASAIEEALAEAGIEPSSKPKKIGLADLLELLDDLRELLIGGDSMEGHIRYEWGDEPDTYNVVAAIRFGNSAGQGGVRLIGER